MLSPGNINCHQVEEPISLNRRHERVLSLTADMIHYLKTRWDYKPRLVDVHNRRASEILVQDQLDNIFGNIFFMVKSDGAAVMKTKTLYMDSGCSLETCIIEFRYPQQWRLPYNVRRHSEGILLH